MKTKDRYIERRYKDVYPQFLQYFELVLKEDTGFCRGIDMREVNVYGYVRVSTYNQVREGYSLEEQKDQIQEFCRQNKYNLVDILNDDGKSGAAADEEELSIDREGLQTMLAGIRENNIKYIIVLNTSRLWRSDMVKVLIHRELKKNGVDIKAIERPTYSIYENGPSNVLINGMMELLDNYERLEIALKLKRGRSKKASLGGYSGGGAAIGYTAKNGSKILEVDEEKYFTVQRVFELRKDYPELTLQAIADTLNMEGHTTKQGKLFTPTQVKRILERYEFYSGIYSYAKIKAKGRHEAII